MNQKIFSMSLGVETVSLYLLCCAVADAGAAITPRILMDKWNGDRSSLERELLSLEERNILCRTDAEGQDDPVYRIVDDKNWR
jgi:hypothetical protein